MFADRGGPEDAPVRVLLVGPHAWQDRLNDLEEQVAAATFEFDAVETGEVDDFGRGTVDCLVTHRPPSSDRFAQWGDANEPSVIVVPETVEDVDGEQGSAGYVVPLEGEWPGPTGVEGVAQYLRREKGAATRRRRAARFDSLFADADRFVAVLDDDGTVRSLNEAARTRLGDARGPFVGKRIWALPWRESASTRRTVQHAVRRAEEGEYTTFEATLPAGEGGDGDDVLEFRLQPVGETGEILLQGSARSEREELQAELRASEELHRVTLNNMTDTVLVTDETGAFTYVCPNVHFIFGYSAEEIHEMGTIDALLGGDLYDDERLQSEGTISNIEVTATDKGGATHTLLVNVREVAIQGGTRLYSCRDITTRKQREEALTQLHETSSDLLYAETKAEIAERVATDATTALSQGGIAIYHFDDGESTLYPIAASEPFWDRWGSIPEVSLDQPSCIAHAFVEQETTASSAPGGATESLLGDRTEYVAVPLGEQGVLVVSAVDRPALDDIDTEIGELLAATTEAAFDRLDREQELRERDERLQSQNRRLAEINTINQLIRDVDQALVQAETREEIEEAVCDRLTADERFDIAWIGEPTVHDRTLRPRVWNGDADGYLDAVSLSPDGTDDPAEPAVRTLQTRRPTLVENVGNLLHDAPWCKEAVSHGLNSALSVPLVYDDVFFGTLSLYAAEPAALTERTRDVFEELGRTIGSAINSVQRKEALKADSVYRLAYDVRDDSSLLVRLAAATEATLQVSSEISQDDAETVVFLTVEGADPSAVAETARSYLSVADAEVIRTTADGGVVSLDVDGPFITALLADHGATRRRLTAKADGLSLVVDVADNATIRSVSEMLAGRFTDVDLRSQRKESGSLDEQGGDDEALTDRQREVLQVAYFSGFFDANRSITGKEVAATLDISPTAFYDHVRRAERKLVASLLDTSSRKTVE